MLSYSRFFLANKPLSTHWSSIFLSLNSFVGYLPNCSIVGNLFLTSFVVPAIDLSNLLSLNFNVKLLNLYSEKFSFLTLKFPSLKTYSPYSICVVTLQKSLSSLELPGIASVANAMSRQNSLSFTGSVDESRHGDNGRHGAASSVSHYSSKQKHKSNDPGRDLSIQVLEKFSLVTKFARDTTSSLFRDNSGTHAYGRQQHEYILDNKANDKHSSQYIAPETASTPSAPLEVIDLAFNLV